MFTEMASQRQAFDTYKPNLARVYNTHSYKNPIPSKHN